MTSSRLPNPRLPQRCLSCLLFLAAPNILPASHPAFAQAPPPPRASGAPTLEALRQSYLDAAHTRQIGKLDALFEWTGVPAHAHAEALKHFAEDFESEVVSATIRDAVPADTEVYTQSNLHFNHPVLKLLEIKFPKEKSMSTTFFIGRCGAGYCLLNVVSEPPAHGRE